jgi:hypothetical protein
MTENTYADLSPYTDLIDAARRSVPLRDEDRQLAPDMTGGVCGHTLDIPPWRRRVGVWRT